ncbi:MAG: beta-galactosidase trimerization domain-containing protein, partial [Armatimonadetes bacterium]|nr:beta-galactosidase trimerization domain-containing protein [Armatimonadota bacterium]
RVSADLPASALPDLTRRWIAEACAHGARGVGFDSWPDLRAVPGLSATISEEISKFSQPAYAQIWGEAPINTSAILLTPLADGATLPFGTPPQRFPRGLYGFGENLVSGEPSTLVQALRWGTAFGGIDYISPDDLNDAPLERYRTLVAPQLLSAGAETTAQLTSYVSTGGVLIADLGVGAMQNGGEVSALPPPLAELFGISGALTMRSVAFNLAGVAPHPLFPAWSNLIAARPGAALTTGDAPDGSAFAGPVGLSLAPPQATILATGPRIGQKSGAVNRVLSAPLTINSVGRGYALFAPFQLWTLWRPGHAGFDTFLGDAMRRDAAVTLPTATSLVPLPATAALGQTLFPEIVNRSTSVTLSNHNAPGSQPQMSVVQTAGAGDWLWSGGLIHFTPRTNSALVGGRGAPIEGAGEGQTRPRPVLLYAVLRPGEMRALSMRPIALQNVDGGPLAAQINEESAQRLKISVWPNAETILPHEGEWNAAIAAPAPVRMTLFSSPSGYLAAPGTRHRARIVNYSKAMGKNRYLTTEKIAAVDARGQLIFEFSGAHCAVEITPVVQPASGSNPQNLSK